MPIQVTVVMEHMFHPSEMEEEATLREDLEDDIKTECLKMGPLEKVPQHFSVLLSFSNDRSCHSSSCSLLQEQQQQTI